MSTRDLLKAGEVESIPFDRTRMVSRKLEKGSRLLVLLDVNKNDSREITYGTGKDVSFEDINDAKLTLEVKWQTEHSNPSAELEELARILGKPSN